MKPEPNLPRFIFRLAGLLIAALILLPSACVQKKGDKDPGLLTGNMKEQFAQSPALYFEKDGKELLLTIMHHRKIISYTRRGNMIQKQAVTTYFLQTNDAATAAKIAEKEVIEQAAIQNRPVDVLGAAGSTAWLFIGEPMAFDAFTLEKKADIKILEDKNKQLTGKFPTDKKYYRFDPATGNLRFTATDGTKWELNTTTLLAAEKEFAEQGMDAEQQLAEVEKAEQQNRADLDSLYQQKDRRPSQQYAARQITSAEYNRITKEYRAERDILDKIRDSLREARHRLQDTERSGRARENNREQLESGIPNYSDIRINQDTLNTIWYGLYSADEFKDLNESLAYQSEMDETARRQLYLSSYKEVKPGNWKFDKASATTAVEKNSFLHGGFLLDRKTALPIHPGGNAFIIVHKDQIGKVAMLQVSLVQTNGKTNWTLNTKMKDWADWIFTGKKLFILGTNNDELSSGQVNVLLCIDLSTGKVSRYDYYKDQLMTNQP